MAKMDKTIKMPHGYEIVKNKYGYSLLMNGNFIASGDSAGACFAAMVLRHNALMQGKEG
jgi:hypothetical protein